MKEQMEVVCWREKDKLEGGEKTLIYKVVKERLRWLGFSQFYLHLGIAVKPLGHTRGALPRKYYYFVISLVCLFEGILDRRIS